MRLARFDKALGMVETFAPARKEWIPVALAAAGLATSLVGGVKASAAAKDSERRQRQREAEERASYLRRYNENYVDTAAGQALVTRAKDYARENWRKASGAAAVSGSTDAAAQVAKDAGNRMVGDTISNIAATDTQRKAQLDAQHDTAREKFAQMDMARDMQRSQAITQASQGASNALLSAASAMGQPNQSKTNLAGGSNSGTAVAVDPAIGSDALREQMRRDAFGVWA